MSTPATVSGSGMTDAFVGRGVAFPFQADAGGAVMLRGGGAVVEQSIRLILSTRPGERPMRPEFGCSVHDLAFSPAASPRTVGAVTRAVQDALLRWEPRIEVESVTAIPDVHEPALLRVEVVYRIKATNDARNLVFPFYTIPPEAGAARQPEVGR